MANVEYSDNDVKYLRGMIEHADPVVTAVELADKLGVTQQAAHGKLTSLERKGLVSRKKVGSKAVVWWPTTTAREVYREATS